MQINPAEFKLLVVDDVQTNVLLLKALLGKEGYGILVANNGQEALEVIRNENPDLILLDVMMPGMDGNEVCAKIRQTSTIPIIMLSAKDSESDKVSGLVNGADDYVTKPFNTSELIARVNSQLRRYHSFGGVESKTSDVVNIENLWMDKSLHEVKAYGNPVKLTPIEFDILFLMASHPNKVFSTDEIFERVWKEKSFEMSNTVMVHIRRLREKIESGSDKSKIIKTVWGVGYKIEA